MVNKMQRMAVAFGDARHIYVSKSKRNRFNKSILTGVFIAFHQ